MTIEEVKAKIKTKTKTENREVRPKSEMKLDNSKMKIENLKLKSQPRLKGQWRKWKSAKLLGYKTMTKVTQTCTETDAVALLTAL